MMIGNHLFTKGYRKLITHLKQLYSEWSLPEIKQPLFIIGCGRSGTTILGTAMSYHPQITYLNEPRNLWYSCYPMTDIWTENAKEKKGKLVMTRVDADPKRSRKLRQKFYAITQKSGKPILVEKLPINTFRLDFISQIFPDARFIHIVRNGLEVARSIETLCHQGQWFASHPYKWDLLAEYASLRQETSTLPTCCESYYEKGLLEWRLSTEAVFIFKKTFPEARFYEISYKEFLHDPVITMHNIFSFIDIPMDDRVTDFLFKNVTRRTPELQNKHLSVKEQFIGGDLLARILS